MKLAIYRHISDLAQNKYIKITLFALVLTFVLASGVYTATRSAEIHSYNHDQLIDNYMFDSVQDFRDALFPAPHTFLIKWPIFALSGILGNSTTVFTVSTVSIYLISVLSVGLLLYLITRKNILLTSLVLLVYGLVLLITPVQSSPGILAPVNMAMITTRNLEYIMFILFILCTIRIKKIPSFYAFASIATITILGLSDKLFLLIGLSAAALHVSYSIFFSMKHQSKRFLWKSILPLICIMIGYVLVALSALAINYTNLTNIYQPLDAAPFNFVKSVSQATLAGEWAIHAILVNFGVNPFGEKIGLKILPSIINGLFLIFSIIAFTRLYIKNSANIFESKNSYYLLGYWLWLSSIGALIIYIASDHYLENDLRYMGIFTFAAIVSMALYLQSISKSIKPAYLLTSILILLLASPIYLYTARSNYNTDLNGTKQIFESRFHKISEEMKNNNVKILIAEYWNTSPVRYRLNNSIEIAPLVDTPCVKPNYHLTSKIWYKPTNQNSRSAIVVTKNKSEQSDKCLENLITALGRPEKTTELSHKDELLLIYNYDIRGKITW